MKKERIWLSSPTMHGEEINYIKEAFAANWIAPLGPHVDGLEQEMAAYLGLGHAAALSSGTAALHLALKLAGVKRGDVVFCSDLTFAATVNPICYEGAAPVFIDCERLSWNIDPRALELAFEKYPACKCVIAVNLYGTPAQWDEIKAVCDAHNAVIIEDAAESLGATYKGKQTGSFGKYSALSFNGNKIITTSGGGMLLSDDEAAIKKARFWATQSREPVPWYEHQEIGYNYRMSNIAAAIGRGQLLHLDEHRARKKRIFQRYQEAFADIDAISMNPYLPGSEPNFWLSCITLDPMKTNVAPADIIAALEAENIEARPIWKPMHLQPVFTDCDFVSSENDVGGEVFKQGICLPSDIKMGDKDLDKIITIIRGVLA